MKFLIGFLVAAIFAAGLVFVVRRARKSKPDVLPPPYVRPGTPRSDGTQIP